MLILNLNRNTVVHAKHDAKVAKFHAAGIGNLETKAFDCSIVAYTLNSDWHRRIAILTFNLKSLG